MVLGVKDREGFSVDLPAGAEDGRMEVEGLGSGRFVRIDYFGVRMDLIEEFKVDTVSELAREGKKGT